MTTLLQCACLGFIISIFFIFCLIRPGVCCCVVIKEVHYDGDIAAPILIVATTNNSSTTVTNPVYPAYGQQQQQQQQQPYYATAATGTASGGYPAYPPIYVQPIVAQPYAGKVVSAAPPAHNQNFA